MTKKVLRRLNYCENGVGFSPRFVRRLEQWDRRHLWHPFTQHYYREKEPPLIIASGRGATLVDVRGRRFLDGVSSLWVNLHGHAHPALNRAMIQQIGRISHSTFLGQTHPAAILLARALIPLAPRGLTRCFYSDNGATAVEVALKMAFQFWRETAPPRAPVRDRFLAIAGSYHGDTLGAVSVGGMAAFHSKFKPLLFQSRFAMAPHCYRCPFNARKHAFRHRLGEQHPVPPKPGDANADTGCRWECLGDAERIFKREGRRLAAVVVEPVVQGAGGIIVMPPGYVAGLDRLRRRTGVLLIADEVATGFCRTGTLFACEQERVAPDFLCLAKALTGGYAPLAATLTSERIFRAFVGPIEKGRTFFHGHSYTGYPVGAAVALESLNLIKKSKLLEKTRHKAHLLRRELRALEHLPHVGSIRQAGLVAGVEVVRDKATGARFPAAARTGARICRRMLTHGVWLRPLGDVIVLMPPPVISDADLRRMVRSLRQVLQDECTP